MGTLLEPIAAHWFEKKTGNLVMDDTFLYQHPDHPYALANIDRPVYPPRRWRTGHLGVQKLHLPQGLEIGRGRYSPLL